MALNTKNMETLHWQWLYLPAHGREYHWFIQDRKSQIKRDWHFLKKIY